MSKKVYIKPNKINLNLRKVLKINGPVNVILRRAHEANSKKDEEKDFG